MSISLRTIPSKPISRHAKAFLAFSALALAAAACGSSSASTSSSTTTSGASSSSSATSSSIGNTTVHVGVIPVADSAALYVGIKQGFFAKQHLTVVPQIIQSAPAIVPLMLHNQLQFATFATVPFLAAIGKGIPLTAVTNGSVNSAAADPTGIFVLPNSGITTASQLGGKTIAVNALSAVLTLADISVMKKADPSVQNPNFLIFPFPAMLAALQTGKVNAITTVEPFTSEAIKAGYRLVARPYSGGLPAASSLTVYSATKSYVASNKLTVTRFATAMREATAYAAAHPGAVRTAIAGYTGIPASLANVIKLDPYSSTLSPALFSKTEALMKKFGYLTSIPSPTSFINP